jgi:cysteine desulfurase
MTSVSYLDANASEPIRPEARAAMLAALDLGGNPSSIHRTGQAARGLLEDARDAVARVVGATAAGVVFTSGGTEADALAIHALGAGRRLIIGATEHDAVRAAAPGADILAVDADGLADLDALRRLLDGPPALVCLMLANNETGVIHPVAEAAALCRGAGALLHVDAAQAVGRIAIDVAAIGADSLAISGHKLGGPQGAGALVVSPHVRTAPLILGGGQERGWRGGTPPLPAIAGLGAAMSAARAETLALRHEIERVARSCGAVVVGDRTARLPNTACLALPGVAAQLQVMNLDLAGIRVSAGAACSSGKVTRSHVLDAMGLQALAGCAIRVSLPWNATAAHVAAFADAYAPMARRLSRQAS